jgi:ubiquinone/menaquinone biosynthesis C-methylase UbiE
MNHKSCLTLSATAPLLLAICLACSTLMAQEQSVKPGINKSFDKPNVTDFEGRFEKEGREAFDHRKEIVAACQLKPGMAVADVGAGTGLFTRLFAREVGQDGLVYAVDIAPEFVAHIERSAREEQLTNVRGVLCKPDSVELPANSVDLVFICDTYHHFEYPQKTLKSIHQALKPGGRLVVVDYRRVEGESSAWTLNHVRAGQEVFTKEITDSGFKLESEVKDLLKENYLLIFTKADQ